jgi:uncharacterized membrane protein
MKDLGNIDGSTRTVGSFLVILVFLSVVGAAFAAEPFEIICDGEATAISADGSVVVGIDRETRETWRWTKKSGRVLLGRSSGSATEINWGTPDVSDDGRVVSATVTSADSESFPADLTDVPGAERQKRNSLAWGLSGDGTTLVGQVRFSDDSTGAAVWNAQRGLVMLGAAGNNSRANDCSADGSIVVGWSESPDTGIWQPTVWTEGRPVLLASTKAFCEAVAVNRNGHIIVGQAYDETSDQRAAALWLNSDFGWVQEWLGTLPGTIGGYGQSMALDLTDDGHTIVGFNSLDPNRSVGFIWTFENGLREAHDQLAGHDVFLPEGFRINAITGISNDGSYMTGYGEDTTFWPRQTRSFLIQVKEFPRDEPRKKILPAGTDISNPFKTRDLE